jgi:hypothetical protein
MYPKAFWLGVFDRAIKTAAQSLVLYLLAGKAASTVSDEMLPLDAFTVNWKAALGFMLGGAILSVVTSLMSGMVGEKGTTSMVPGTL